MYLFVYVMYAFIDLCIRLLLRIHLFICMYAFIYVLIGIYYYVFGLFIYVIYVFMYVC